MANKKLSKEQAKELLRRIDEYKGELFDNPKVSPTKFDHFQTALYGVKCLVKDMAGMPRSMEVGWTK